MENSVADGTVHRDMRPGLIIFGIFSILLGVMCLLMVPLMLFGAVVQTAGGQAASWAMTLPAAIFYLGLAVVSIWLGIGSILCRRWARALMLLFSLFWLVSGVFAMVVMLLMMGDMKAGMLQSMQAAGSGSPALASGIMAVMLATLGIVYVVIPGAFSAFYALRSTRLTCEARDPKVRWTDRCPLPLLGLVLLHGLMAVCFPMALFYAPVFPFYGKWMEGAPALMAILGLSLVLGCGAWGMYRRMWVCWALALGAVLAVAGAYMVTLGQTGLMEFYRHMEMPAEMLKALEQMPFLQNKFLAWLGFLYLIPYAGWMVWCLRYFPARADAD
jgi:hypothetical protein